MKNEDLCDLIFRKNFTFGRRTSKFANENPKIAPPQEKKEALQEKAEKGTPNDEYENFVEAHLEAAAKCIPTKPRTKYRAPWETPAVREKRALVKTASKSYQKNPTNTNARKLEKAQHQLTGIYLKEQAEYI